MATYQWLRTSRSSGVARRAFTFRELLIIVGILGVLLGILVPTVAAVRNSARATECLVNLRQISGAMRQYAVDFQGLLPDPYLNQKSWEASIYSYVAGKGTFICPSDNEVAPATGSSYDWRDTGDPKTTVAGQNLWTIARGNAVFVFDALPGWHGKHHVNAVDIDGSARDWDEVTCFNDLGKPVR